MNTAQTHWNQEAMRDYLGGRFDRPIVNAAVVLGISVGLTSEDISENIFADVGLDEIRLTTPVFGGDTLSAKSIILETADDPSHARIARSCAIASRCLIRTAPRWARSNGSC